MSALAEKYEKITENVFQLHVIEGGLTPKKKGTTTGRKRSTWVDPIRDIKDINKVIEYLNNKIKEKSIRPDHKKTWLRNKMYFCIAIFSGFRSCDLIGGKDYKTKEEYDGLRWSDIFFSDGKTFRSDIAIIEKKTGKSKYLTLSDVSKKAILQYVNECPIQYKPDTTSKDPVFTNRQGERLTYSSINDFVKDFAANCDLIGNYGTHSLRKTYAYQMYMSLDKSGDSMALEKVSAFLNHSNMSDTYKYLGLDRDVQKKATKTMENYLEDMCGGMV